VSGQDQRTEQDETLADAEARLAERDRGEPERADPERSPGSSADRSTDGCRGDQRRDDHEQTGQHAGNRRGGPLEPYRHGEVGGAQAHTQTDAVAHRGAADAPERSRAQCDHRQCGDGEPDRQEVRRRHLLRQRP